MNEDPFRLSLAGAARKDEIFGLLLAAQKQRRNRRRTTQAGAGVLAMLAAGLAGWAALRAGAIAPTPVPPITQRIPRQPIVGTEIAPGAKVLPPEVTVHNDPTVLARLSARGDAGRTTIIGDGELDDLLTRAGRPAGFIRTPGRFLLASDVDPPAAPPPPGRG